MGNLMTIRVEGTEFSIKDDLAREHIGDLSQLKTAAKNDLVSAINEVSQSGDTGESGMSATASALLISILRNGVYTADQSANITALEAALLSGGGETPEDPIVPDEPENPEVVLSSISATYSGGDVPVGTAVTDLTGIVVTAHYSDGSTETVTDYTLSGTIAEGSNTITVSYGGKTTTCSVTGVTNNNLISGMYQVGLLKENGGLNTASTTAYTSDYMECAGMESIYILIKKDNAADMNHYYRALGFYDGDKNVISGLYTGIMPTENIEPITVPTGAVYCRVTFAKTYAAIGTLLYVGENIPEDTSQFVAFTTVIE